MASAEAPAVKVTLRAPSFWTVFSSAVRVTVFAVSPASMTSWAGRVSVSAAVVPVAVTGTVCAIDEASVAVAVRVNVSPSLTSLFEAARVTVGGSSSLTNVRSSLPISFPPWVAVRAAVVLGVKTSSLGAVSARLAVRSVAIAGIVTDVAPPASSRKFPGASVPPIAVPPHSKSTVMAAGGV